MYLKCVFVFLLPEDTVSVICWRSCAICCICFRRSISTRLECMHGSEEKAPCSTRRLAFAFETYCKRQNNAYKYIYTYTSFHRSYKHGDDFQFGFERDHGQKATRWRRWLSGVIDRGRRIRRRRCLSIRHRTDSRMGSPTRLQTRMSSCALIVFFSPKRWNNSNGCFEIKVALQFPDELLNISVRVNHLLNKKLSQDGGDDDCKFFILADTSYGRLNWLLRNIQLFKDVSSYCCCNL